GRDGGRCQGRDLAGGGAYRVLGQVADVAGDVGVLAVGGQGDQLRRQYGARGRGRPAAERAGGRVDAVLGDDVIEHRDDVGVLAVGTDRDGARVSRGPRCRGRHEGQLAGGRADAVLRGVVAVVIGDVGARAVRGDGDPDRADCSAARATMLRSTARATGADRPVQSTGPCPAGLVQRVRSLGRVRSGASLPPPYQITPPSRAVCCGSPTAYPVT